MLLQLFAAKPSSTVTRERCPMKISDAGKVAAAIGILAAGLTGFHAQAFAATGKINVQTVPEGARYLIVTNRALEKVHEGTSPFYDLAFPTGKYTVCFELEGYVTVWQDSAVSTYGSSWIGPIMEPLKGAARITCEDDLTRMKTERGLVKALVLDKIKSGEITFPTGETTPADVTPGLTGTSPLLCR